MTVHFRIGFKPVSLLVRFPGNQFIAKLLISRKGFFDDDERGVRGLDVFHLNLLAFELFVILEKAAQTRGVDEEEDRAPRDTR